jgi:hypothetical protein
MTTFDDLTAAEPPITDDDTEPYDVDADAIYNTATRADSLRTMLSVVVLATETYLANPHPTPRQRESLLVTLRRAKRLLGD